MQGNYKLTDGNVIVADAEFIAENYPDAVLVGGAVPPVEKCVTLLTFRSEFTDAEKIDIYTAARTEVAVQVWLDDLAAVQGQMVNKADPRIIGGVCAMEYGGLIGVGRAAEILA